MTIRKTLDFLFEDGEVFEVCLIGSPVPKHPLWDNDFSKGKIVAGWFDDKDMAEKAILRAEKEVKPSGIYITVNPTTRALLGRASNRLKANVSRTSDTEIERVSNLYIDVDPKRPSGISASDEELNLSKEVSNLLYKDLKKHGFPDPLCAKSGNGFHFIYKVQDVESDLIKAFLHGLAEKYSTIHADIDTTVFNPARLIKMYGTTARKGENIPDRPHRMSSVSSFPKKIEFVRDVEKIASLNNGYRINNDIL